MIIAGLLVGILITLIVIAAILLGLRFRLDAIERQVEHWRREWVQFRRDDAGRVSGSPHE
jgi:hypothetical protein